ncbi:MAG: anthranilate synthase component I, partial [Lysinibacillus sp.]
MTVETSMYAMKKLQGDMMTPISVYQSLEGERKMLFESSAKHEESGRYSFITVSPIAELVGDAQGYSYTTSERKEQSTGAVLEKLKEVMPIHDTNYPFAFFGGAIGLFGYETAFYAEKIGELLHDELEMPEVHVFFYDTFIIFDHLTQEITLAAIDLFGEGRTIDDMEAAVALLETQLHSGKTFGAMELGEMNFQPMIPKEQFVA